MGLGRCVVNFMMLCIVVKNWNPTFADPNCIVKKLENEHETNCTFMSIDRGCNRTSTPKFLKLLPRGHFPPEVRSLYVRDRLVRNGNVYISINWTYKMSGDRVLKLKGFLFKIEIISDTVEVRYMVVKYSTKNKHLEFNLDDVELTDATESSSIVITIWSIIYSKNSHRKVKGNISICRHYAEHYEDYGRFKESTRITPNRNIRVISSSEHNEPDSTDNNCSCWKNDIKINISKSDMYVFSENFCQGRLGDIQITEKYLESNQMKITKTEKCELTECCIKFPSVPKDLYRLWILFICITNQSGDEPTCSNTKEINITQGEIITGQIIQNPQSSDTKSTIIITAIVITVTVIFCVTVTSLILHRRKRKKYSDDMEMRNLLSEKEVLFISHNKETSKRYLDASKHFTDMLIELRLKLISSDNVLDELFQNRERLTPEDMKGMTANKISHFKHFIISTSKDLYDSYEITKKTQRYISTVSRENNQELYYFLIDAVSDVVRIKPGNQTRYCHFVAPGDAEKDHCRKMYSFVRPPRGSSEKYCLIKQGTFNAKHFDLLVRSLLKSEQNKEDLRQNRNIDTIARMYAHTLQRRNNDVIASDSSSTDSGAMVSLTEPKLPTNSTGPSSLTELKSTTDLDINDTSRKTTEDTDEGNTCVKEAGDDTKVELFSEETQLKNTSESVMDKEIATETRLKEVDKLESATVMKSSDVYHEDPVRMRDALGTNSRENILDSSVPTEDTMVKTLVDKHDEKSSDETTKGQRYTDSQENSQELPGISYQGDMNIWELSTTVIDLPFPNGVPLKEMDLTKETCL